MKKINKDIYSFDIPVLTAMMVIVISNIFLNAGKTSNPLAYSIVMFLINLTVYFIFKIFLLMRIKDRFFEMLQKRK